jgi:hypothetical protein
MIATDGWLSSAWRLQRRSRGSPTRQKYLPHGCCAVGGVLQLYGLYKFWEEGVLLKVLSVEVGFDGLEIRHASRDDSCSVSCATEPDVFTYHKFSCFHNWCRLRQMLKLLEAVDLFWQELLPHVVRPRCWQNPWLCQVLREGRRN